MTKKNLRLALLLAVLLLISVGLSFWDRQPPVKRHSDIFKLENVEHIDRIVMQKNSQVLDAKAYSGGFLINDSYPMDPQLMTLLATVLQRVNVQRPVAEDRQSVLFDSLKANGTLVELYRGEDKLKSFWAGGDPSQNRSYFSTPDGEVYLVNLPGYTSYLGGLFQLEPHQWRSKNLIQSTWRSLLSFSINKLQQPQSNLSIEYSDPFFKVQGVQQIDSNKVVNYLEGLTGLRALQSVDTSFQGSPWLELKVEDVNPSRNLFLTVYPGDSLLLAKAGKRHYIFRKSQIEQLLKDPEYFSHSSINP